MSTAASVATAVAFTWLGMVAAISFIETPLKFRAPGVTMQIGLGIGRLVFRTLNAVEGVLAVALLVALVVDKSVTEAMVFAGVAMAALVSQVVLVRPVLTRRSNRVLAGENPQRSSAHYFYIGLELAKVVALPVAGVLLMSA